MFYFFIQRSLMHKVDNEDSGDEHNAGEDHNGGEDLFCEALAAAGRPCDDSRPGKYLCSILEADVSFTRAETALKKRPALAGADVQFFLDSLLPGRNVDFLFL